MQKGLELYPEDKGIYSHIEKRWIELINSQASAYRKRIDGSSETSIGLTGKDFAFIAREDEDDDEDLPLSRNPRHYVPLAIFALANLPPVWHCLATGNSDLLILTCIGGSLLLPRERSTTS